MARNGASRSSGELQDLDTAVTALCGRLQPIVEVEQVSLLAARGRYLARGLHAVAPVPGFANSAMDGYALDATLLAAGLPRLRVIGHSRAGHPAPRSPGAGECVRIATGAPLPPGANAVVIQENTRVIDDMVEVLVPPAINQWVRAPGHDFAAGSTVAQAGTRLEARHIGLIAAAGFATIDVVRRPRICVLSTGDELREPGQTLLPGQIHDANRYTLLTLLQEAGASAIDGGRVADSAAAVRAALDAAAAHNCDLILTSGGVSVGDPDFVGRVLDADGEVEFWKVAVKPGKPLLFARYRGCWVIGLPGNPVSTFVTFTTVVRAALATLCGAPPPAPPVLRLPLEHAIGKEAGRLEFQRGIIRHDASGRIGVASTGNQSSGMLSSICAANCFIRLPRAAADLAAGSLVDVMPFHGCLD